VSQPPKVLARTVLSGGPVVLGHPLEGDMLPESPRAREARQRGYAEGRRAGRAEGLAEGREAVGAELRSARAALAAAAEQLVEERRRLLEHVGDGALELALAVARKVVHAELGASAQAAARVVEAALARAGEAAVVRVRVSPSDVERIEQAGSDGVGRGLLVADPAVTPGGCVVETDCGCVDATVEAQWEALRAALAEAADGSAPSDACDAGPGGDDDEGTHREA